MKQWSIEYAPARFETGFTSVLFRCIVEEEALRLGRDLDNLDEDELKILAAIYLIRSGALHLRVRPMKEVQHETD